MISPEDRIDFSHYYVHSMDALSADYQYRLYCGQFTYARRCVKRMDALDALAKVYLCVKHSPEYYNQGEGIKC